VWQRRRHISPLQFSFSGPAGGFGLSPSALRPRNEVETMAALGFERFAVTAVGGAQR
jgi:hypothetical protein